MMPYMLPAVFRGVILSIERNHPNSVFGVSGFWGFQWKELISENYHQETFQIKNCRLRNISLRETEIENWEKFAKTYRFCLVKENSFPRNHWLLLLPSQCISRKHKFSHFERSKITFWNPEDLYLAVTLTVNVSI